MNQSFEENDFNAQFQAKYQSDTNQEKFQAGQLFQEYSINSKKSWSVVKLNLKTRNSNQY